MGGTELITQGSPFTQQQLDLIKATVARGATNDELKLFLYTSARTKLDPLTKQIHFVKRKVWNKDRQSYDEVGTIQTGIDGYRVIAERTGTLAGIDDAIYDDETGDHPNKASVTVYRIIAGARVAFTASARWSEYAQVDFKTKEPVAMWKKMPYLMLAKCAETLALRKAFPNDLSGVYTNEEMQQADVQAEANQTEDVHYEPVALDPVDVMNEAKDYGRQQDLTRPVPMDRGQSIQTCPFCGKEHNGKYPKCLECWKEEEATGIKKEKLPATKTVINGDVEPFH